MDSFDATLESATLDKELDVIVYGTGGRPIIVFPTFDSSAGCWETNGMIDILSDPIESGKIQLFCVDSVDDVSWYARNSDLAYRSENQDAYLDFVAKELLAYVKKTAKSKRKPLLAGCGVGATNALAALLRSPKSYGGALLLSGAYDARFYSDGIADDRWLACSPIDLLANLKPAQLKVLEALPVAIICGQADDETGIETMRRLDEAFAARKLDASFEYWGFDVSHDWHWWQLMVEQFLPIMLKAGGLAERRHQYVEEYANAAAFRLEEAEHEHAVLLDDEKAAQARLLAEQEGIEKKKLAAEKAQAAAQVAWDKRNEAAAKLAELDSKASALQVEADAAAKALSDAHWFAGEAREALEFAQAATKDAQSRVEAARQAAEAADEARRKSAEQVEEFKHSGTSS